MNHQLLNILPSGFVPGGSRSIEQFRQQQISETNKQFPPITGGQSKFLVNYKPLEPSPLDEYAAKKRAIEDKKRKQMASKGKPFKPVYNS